jgi:hypothetical protein
MYQLLLKTQKHYGKSIRKMPNVLATNGIPFHAKAEKSRASNASADTNTHKNAR